MASAVAARARTRMAGRGRRSALDQAREMPDRAHDALDGLPASDQADTAFGYTQRQPFIPKATRCSRWVTPSGQARAFGKALRRYQPGEFLDRSLIVLGRARCPAVREYREALLTG